jgi:hypothetical protein
MLGLKQQEMANMDIWNNSQVFLGKTIALILGDLFYLQNAMAKLDTFSSVSTRNTFATLTRLWFLKVLRENEFVDGTHYTIIERLMGKLCDEVANESLGILESLSTCDKVIGSPFACP